MARLLCLLSVNLRLEQFLPNTMKLCFYFQLQVSSCCVVTYAICDILSNMISIKMLCVGKQFDAMDIRKIIVKIL